MNENALLRLENLKKSFDGNPVLKGICLDVMPGEFVTLLRAVRLRQNDHAAHHRGAFGAGCGAGVSRWKGHYAS